MAGRQKKKAAPVPFPFPEDHYISTPSTARLSHSSGGTVAKVNEALGVEGDVFNSLSRDALMEAQRKAKLPVTGVVDPETWDALFGDRGDGAEAGDE